MRVDDEIAKCVGFIGAPGDIGFYADGTCFFVFVTEETERFYYVFTARHLVRPTQFGKELLPADGTVKIRITRKGKPPLIVPTIRGDWVCHADRHVDIAAIPFDLRKWDADDDLDLATLNLNPDANMVLTDRLKDHFGVLLGDGVFFPSLFTGHVRDQRNTPILRVGNIAALPLDPIRGGSPTKPAYLIETRSLGGASGAPVFVHTEPDPIRARRPAVTNPQTGQRSFPYILIGMLLGSHSGKYAADFVQENDEETIVAKDAEFNAGISVVVPVAQIMEVINGPILKESRMATLEAIKKQTGYRPSSASTSDVSPGEQTSPTASNPTHREDFTTLLGAAAKKRPQGDKT